MINIAKALRQLRDQASAEVDAAINRIFGFTLTASSSAMGDEDAMQVSDKSQDGQRPVQRIEPYGLRSRPVAKLRGLWLRLGSSNVAFIGVMPNKGYGPTDLDDGETAVYNLTKALVRLWKSGKLTLDSDSEDVVVNGGSLKVARKTDKTIADTSMTTWITNVTAAAATINPSIVAPTDFGVINGGANNFKA